MKWCIILLSYAALIGAGLFMAAELSTRNQTITELQETVQFLANPENELVVVVNENIKSRQDRVRIKMEDLIEFFGYPYVGFGQLDEMARLVVKYSDRYQVPENLILAVMNRESAFNPLAVSPVGAVGLLQVMPSTAECIAKELGVKEYDLFALDTNIRFGTYYLRKLLKEFDLDHAIKAYNAGPTGVRRGIERGGLHSEETTTYHSKVRDMFDLLASNQ